MLQTVLPALLLAEGESNLTLRGGTHGRRPSARSGEDGMSLIEVIVALSLAGLAAGAFGAMVGIFPMDYHATHRVASALFFLSGWLVPAIFSLWLLTAPRPGFSRWLLAPGAAVVAVFLTFIAIYSTYRPANPDSPVVGRPAGFWSVPFFEWASLVSIMVWLICVSVVLLREPAE